MTNTSWKNETNYPEYSCKKCGQKCWFIGYYRDAGGADKYRYVCFNCGTRTQHFVKRKIVEAAGIKPPDISPQTPPYFCEVCHAEGAQNHHWAPSHLFDGESERWPQSYLCQSCHDRWHKIVTPNANGTRRKV